MWLSIWLSSTCCVVVGSLFLLTEFLVLLHILSVVLTLRWTLDCIFGKIENRTGSLDSAYRVREKEFG